MSNDYFNHDTPLVAHSLARAGALNALFSAIADGFDLIPDLAELLEDRVTFGVDTGAENAYVVTLPHTPSDYTTGLQVAFKPLVANTGAATINVNSLGVKSIIRPDGTSVAAGDIQGLVVLRYDGTSFVLVSCTSDIAQCRAFALSAASSSAAAAASAREASEATGEYYANSASAAADDAIAASAAAQNVELAILRTTRRPVTTTLASWMGSSSDLGDVAAASDFTDETDPSDVIDLAWQSGGTIDLGGVS